MVNSYHHVNSAVVLAWTPRRTKRGVMAGNFRQTFGRRKSPKRPEDDGDSSLPGQPDQTAPEQTSLLKRIRALRQDIAAASTKDIPDAK
jgi:hypothetical protein